MLQEEIKEKKLAASGVHHKTGKRGYVGKMLFPSDIMSRKDKYNHRKAGKIVTTNIYDNIMTFDEFNGLNDEEMRKVLIEYRKRHANKDIMATWGISHNIFYSMLNKLDVPKVDRVIRKGMNRLKDMEPSTPVVVTSVQTPIKETIKQIETKKDGLSLSYYGSYTAEDIVKKLDKIGLILSDETCEFEIDIKIAEKTK